MKRTGYVIVGLLSVVMIGGGLWFFRDRGGEMSGPPQSEKMEGMAMPQPSQAVAMLSPERRQLIGVRTAPVEERLLRATIRAVGTVEYDERRLAQMTLRVPGWITELFVDYTGRFVKKGEPLLRLYSPDLASAQAEYLLARRAWERVKDSSLIHIRRGAEGLVEVAKNKLLLWNLTETQIADLENHGRAEAETTLYSPMDGVVTKKMAVKGMYVTPEMTLYEMADLSTVWVYADIYEYELPFVTVGQEATVHLNALPGKTFRGQVVYLSPSLSPETRTVRARLEVPNPHLSLKPGMFGDVEIQVEAGKKRALPQEAILDSGTRTLVFVDKGGGMYEPREVRLGPKMDRYYEVVEGVSAGEQVVTSATFLIDSESKLMAATSMMGMLGMGGIKMEQARMGEMEMEGMEMGKTPAGTPAAEKRISPVQEKKAGDLTIAFSTVPEKPAMGKNTLRVKLSDQMGMAVTDATVGYSWTMTMPGMAATTAKGVLSKGGLYEAEAQFMMGGEWEVTVIVSRPGRPELKEKFIIVAGGM